MRVGVLQAQEHGVRVHLLGLKSMTSNQSELLVQEADEHWEWEADDLRPFLTCMPRPEPEAGGETEPLTAEAADRELLKVARAEADNVPAAEREGLIRHIQATGFRPKPVDASLLARSSSAIGGEILSDGQKGRVRTAFLDFLVELQRAAAVDR